MRLGFVFLYGKKLIVSFGSEQIFERGGRGLIFQCDRKLVTLRGGNFV